MKTRRHPLFSAFLAKAPFAILSLLLFSVCATSPDNIAQTSSNPTSATTTTATLTTSSTTNAQQAKPVKRVPSTALKIFLETRNVIARPEGYETLLTIEEGGAMTFEWHTVSNKRKTLTGQLTPKEWKALLKTLRPQKFFEAQPTSMIGYADWMQSIAIEKDGKERTLRMMIDYRKRTPEAADRSIQDQLGEKVTKDLWEFIAAVRAINNRFRWAGQ